MPSNLNGLDFDATSALGHGLGRKPLSLLRGRPPKEWLSSDWLVRSKLFRRRRCEDVQHLSDSRFQGAPRTVPLARILAI